MDIYRCYELWTLVEQASKLKEGIFPDETGFEIDERIRFCHIDVDVYKAVKDIVEFVWEKMINGGIIVFDDYGFKTCTGITTLINELKNDKDKIVVENLNGHAIIIKIIN